MIVKDSVALVTGGASGLGLATVKALHDQGASVVILDLPSSNGEFVAKELGDRVRFAAGDVTDEASVVAALDLAESLGPLRVHGQLRRHRNAIKTVGKQGAFPLAEFQRVVNINLVGTFNVLRLAAERIAKTDPIEGERGVIINTASVAAFDGQIGQAAYSGPRAASSHDAADRPRPRVDADPRRHHRAGPVQDPAARRTPGTRAGVPRQAGSAPVAPGDPAEYGSLAAHIVSNPMLNGEVIRLDGAIRMAPR